ncbi:FtsX-like permease family protein [Actinokineospora sp. NBRC 105648]|uniref:ABC transporter permease n=1 Tax=Actinokineospora sp. NBRC 105648 TaxID=3032206 RepID=UPI00249FC934|nr:FtsX-like permease family protein [Actinokineospora sp. NBRC 105648]GLZ43472.1 ABC transporter permease [Actinokineospora sp. NBRC 105648]
MLSLSWQTIKTRASGLVGAFLAVLCGTALMAACGVLIDSGIRSGVPTERYAATSVVVGGKQSVRPEGADALSAQRVTDQPTLGADLVRRIAAVPGVRAAVGEVDFPANVMTDRGELVTGPGGSPSRGHGWGSAVLAPFTLTAGAEPTRSDQVVLDTDLAARVNARVGQRVRIATPGSTATTAEYQVTGLVSANRLTRQSALFFSPDRAAELFGRPGQVHAVGVLADSGVDVDDLAERVEGALNGESVTVSAGVERSSIEFTDVGQARATLTVIASSFAGIALLVMMFVVSSTLALSVAQRRREFALLRAIAATPRQIRRLIATETTLVALPAAVLGSLGGVLLAGWLRDAFAGIGVVPPDFALTTGPIPVAAALVLGVGAARLAGAVTARRPARISPVAALGEAAVERSALGRGRTWTGLVFLLLGVGASTIPLFLHSLVAAGLTTIAALLIVIGLALLGPLVVGRAIRVLAGPLGRLSRVGGYLAAANSVANTRRLSAAITPLMLAVGFAITYFFSQSISGAAVQRETDLATTADHVITSQSGGLPPQVSAAARRVPGVATATSVVRTHAIVASARPGGDDVDVQTVPAIGLDGDQVEGNLDLGSVTGNLADLTGATVALSASEANSQDKELGDEVEFYFGDGTPAKLRLVATYTHHLAFGDFILPAPLARAHSTDLVDTSVLVRLTPGTSTVDAATGLADLAREFPGAVVADRTAMGAVRDTTQTQQFWVSLTAIGVVLGYIVIAVANTLVMTTAQRTREFALLRLVGGTRRQVRHMMRIEATVSAGIAIVIGSLIPILPLALLGIGLAGSPIPTGPVVVYLGIVLGAAILGILAVALPTRFTMRTRPIDAIGLRD